MQEMQEAWIRFLGQEDPLEEEVATHPSILAWRIPWTEEPGRLHTVHRVAKSQTQLSDWVHTRTTCRSLESALKWANPELAPLLNLLSGSFSYA